MCLAGLLPTTEMPRERGSSNRPRSGNGIFVASHHDPKLAVLSYIGAAEDGCGYEPVSAPRVLGSQLFAECDADGTAGDVKRAGFERVHQAVGAEEDFFVSRVVEEHGDHGVGAKLSFCGSACGDCALRGAGVRCAPRCGSTPTIRGLPQAGAAPSAFPSCPDPKNPIFIVVTPCIIGSFDGGASASAARAPLN